MRRREFLRNAGVAAAGWVMAENTEPAFAARTKEERPNILWLSAEDISPLLGCYGDSFAQTPNLDKLAAEGIRYDRVYAHAPVCSPSRSGIITGVYPARLGTHHHRSHATLPENIRCFTEYLREAGYYCSNNNKKDYNFDDAPASWDDSSGKAHWRNRKPGQPFFSVFNHGVCHESLMHKTEEEFERIRRRYHVQPHDPAKVRIPAYHPDTPEFRADWARYYDAITALDAQIAERLNELEEDGLAENTIVMFWGDHGTGIVRGKRCVYESGTRVPFIVRFPEKFKHLAPGPAGSAEARLISFIDLAPAILNLAGVAIPAHMQGTAFLGGGTTPQRENIFIERDRLDEVYDCIRAVRDKRFRYVRNFYSHVPWDQYNQYLFKEQSAQVWHRLAGSLEGPPALFMRPGKPMEELFDTEADPEEIHDLAQDPAHRETLLAMRRRLNDWMLDTRDLGLLDEAELYRRAQGRPAVELGANPKEFDLTRILDTANLPLIGETAVPELITRLTDADSAVRYWAATALAVLNPGATQSAEALRKSLQDDCPSVRVAAAHALCRADDYENALPALMRELQTPDKFVRIRTLNVLALQGKHALPAIEAITPLASDPEEYVQRAAQAALIRINE